MSSVDVPGGSGLARSSQAAVVSAKPAVPWISWVALAFMTIPLCNVFRDAYPDAEIALMGVEEPLTRIHAPNESVDPGEIARMALAEALFLQRYAVA